MRCSLSASVSTTTAPTAHRVRAVYHRGRYHNGEGAIQTKHVVVLTIKKKKGRTKLYSIKTTDIHSVARNPSTPKTKTNFLFKDTMT